jgi:tRNA A37 threonylcarbamoyladenosine biosynthesis protein TsaE
MIRDGCVQGKYIVALSGADGSGKTTTARLLASYLSLYGPYACPLASGFTPTSLGIS